MDVSLTDDLEDFLREKVGSGEFPSKDEVIVMALRSFRDRETTALNDLIDQEFVDFCDREGDESVTLDRVFEATSTIPGSMSLAIIEDGRAERF